jgi:hypothetical protein
MSDNPRDGPASAAQTQDIHVAIATRHNTLRPLSPAIAAAARAPKHDLIVMHFSSSTIAPPACRPNANNADRVAQKLACDSTNVTSTAI